MSKDLFANKSTSWDKNSKRVKSAQSIASVIIEKVDLQPTMKLLDIGAGTGLLSFFVAPYVEKITMLDNSPSMLERFMEKQLEFGCETDVMEASIETASFDRTFDGVISSMTMHHIEDLTQFFTKLYAITCEGGFIAVADLDTENGTFHSDNEGVFHFGFDRNALEAIAAQVGFTNISFETANVIEKPENSFSVFCMTATK
jgi:cyclopropane fatty-acyl-phospholipid synthase-like methyltransferase